VERRRAQLEESVARYLSQLDTADRQEPTEAQTERRRNQTFAPDRHGLRSIADEQPSGREARERAVEMCAADRIEGGIYAGPPVRPAVSPRTEATKSPTR
jgi:hypothetical protein